MVKPTRRSAGDPSRLNRVAARRSSLRFGRNTPGIPPSRALSAGRLAGLGAHAGSTTGCQQPVVKPTRPGCCENAVAPGRRKPRWRAGQGTPASSPGGGVHTGTAPRSGARRRTSHFRDGAPLGTYPTRQSGAQARDRRHPVGTARERETNADDAAPYQRERCTRSQPRPRSPCRGSALSMTGGGCNRTRSSAFLPVGVRPAIHPGPTAGIPPSRALSAGRLASTGRTGQPRRSPGFHHRLSRPDRICRGRVL